MISFFVGWIPLVGPILPGIAAGYLRGSNTKESALTGALANVIASIPLLFLLALFFGLGAIGAAVGGSGQGAIGLVFLFLMAVVGFAYYYYGFGALGGVIDAGITNRGEPR